MLLPAVLWLDPVRFNFYYGELAIFTVAFVATDLWWTRPERWQRWAPQGLLTGIAAAFTLRPVVFALFGAAQRFTGANGASALWVLAVLVVGGALIYAARVFIQRSEAQMAAVSLALAALTASTWAPPYAWARMLPSVFVIGEFAWRRRDLFALLTTLAYLGLSTVFVPHSQFKNMDTIAGRDRVVGDWIMSSVVWWTLLAAAAFAVWAFKHANSDDGYRGPHAISRSSDPASPRYEEVDAVRS